MGNICDMSQVMCLILAGGVGKRLRPLTDHRAKPSVPFGGKYRIIDFSLCNAIESKIQYTAVLTQYKSDDINEHISDLDLRASAFKMYVDFKPAQQLTGGEWFQGTADAVYQNHRMMSQKTEFDTVVILAGDHICKFDIRKLYLFHKEKGSEFTVCGLEMSSSEAAKNFGVMEVNQHSRVVGFEEKPDNPKEILGKEGTSCISAGIYMFDKQFLLKLLGEDHTDTNSSHDFGKDIIPKAIKDHVVHYFNMKDSVAPGEDSFYWRDVGRIGQYHAAQMDLVRPQPQINLYNELWNLRTIPDTRASWKGISPDQGAYIQEFILGDDTDVFFEEKRSKEEFFNFLKEKMCFPNCTAAGGTVFDSPRCLDMVVAGRNVRTEWGASLHKTVLFGGVFVGPRADIQNSILDDNVYIPANTVIGYDVKEDEDRGIHVDEESGIRVVTDTAVFG